MLSNNIAYVAGLFDGEGSVMYKQYIEKRKNRPNPMKCWRIRLDVAMTDKETIKYIYDTKSGKELRSLKLDGVGSASPSIHYFNKSIFTAYVLTGGGRKYGEDAKLIVTKQ